MKLGVCCNPYFPHGWLPPIPTRDSWAALRALGLTHVRLSADLNLMASAPSAMNFGFLDPWTNAITEGGLKIYMNVGSCPPWASENQPAYVGLIPGSAWWNTPGDASGGIHFFDPDPARNPHADVDQTEPARPYLTAAGTPHISGDFMASAASELAGRYGNIVDSWGIWNEPGGDLFYPPIRWDDTNHGGLGDVIATRFMPEVVVPFMTGLRSVLPNPSTIGVEADGDGVLARCLDIEAQREGEPPLFTTAIGFHPYGDLHDDMAYATMDAFLAVVKTRANGRKLWVSEIGGDPQALYDWTVATVTKHPELDSIIYLEPRYFFKSGSWETNKPVVSALGRKFSALFKAINGRKHAVVTP
jgi:hypothetical protein